MIEKFCEFLKTLDTYSRVYKKFEILQKDDGIKFIPKYGDQKTGLIGEIFIFVYLLRCGYSNVEYGNSSQSGWDIRAEIDGKKFFFQVKTVSFYSKTRGISPFCCDSWNKCFLISLDENFIPEKVWSLDKRKIECKRNKQLRGMKMRKVYNDNSGSPKLFKNAEDETEKFKFKFPDVYK